LSREILKAKQVLHVGINVPDMFWRAFKQELDLNIWGKLEHEYFRRNV
jgi:hypothetical protein